MTPRVRLQFLCFGHSLFTWQRRLLSAFFNKHGPKQCSIGKVVHHKHYRGIQQENIYTIPLVLLSDQLW